MTLSDPGNIPVEKMDREQLETAVRHFHKAHVESLDRLAKALRRMTKMEEALTKQQVKQLDKWLDHHANDPTRGDGSDYYQSWKGYQV